MFFMMKKALQISLLALLLWLGSKVFLFVMMYQSLSAFKEANQSQFLLTYEWISTDFDGTLSIENIEFTPYILKRTFKIERLDVSFENYLELLTSVTDIARGDFSRVQSVNLNSLQYALQGRSLIAWWATEYSDFWLKPFGFYACGDNAFLSAEQFREMGINDIKADLMLTRSSDAMGQDQLHLDVDLKSLGRFQLSSLWTDNSLQKALVQREPSGLSLSGIQIRHQEAGFFRRLNVLCNPLENKDRTVFSAFAARAWEQAMRKQGLMVNNQLVDSYREYLLRGGELTLNASFDKGFRLTDYNKLLDQGLFEYFQVQLQINGQSIERAELYIDSQILFPPPPTPLTVETPKAKPEWQPGYYLKSIEGASQYIGYRIRVVMRDQKQYEGVLTSVTEYNLELTQNLPGGQVNYPLMLNAIDTLEIWFNSEPGETAWNE
jgi:hypothetical protein